MRITIVNGFDTYEHRVDLLYKYYINRGHDVTVISSDFRHFEKTRRLESKPGYIFVKVKTYKKNLSVSRLVSHYFFARDAFKVVSSLKTDLIYLLIPPNSLAHFAAKYKKTQPGVKLIYDLIDLWPETMPVAKFKRLPLITWWQQLRDKNISVADFVITECDLYQEVLKNYLENKPSATLYLAREVKAFQNKYQFQDQSIQLCWLGSINNIIDIDLIADLIKELVFIKPVTLHIIGDGENRESLISRAKNSGASVEYHGKIFDAEEKQKIFNQCNFGLNIMKASVCVGLTMKSIDFFEAGLPIINTIKGDTSKFVDQKELGINISAENIIFGANLIASICEIDMLAMRTRSRKLFEDYFSIDAFNIQLNSIMEVVTK